MWPYTARLIGWPQSVGRSHEHAETHDGNKKHSLGHTYSFFALTMEAPVLRSAVHRESIAPQDIYLFSLLRTCAVRLGLAVLGPRIDFLGSVGS